MREDLLDGAFLGITLMNSLKFMGMDEGWLLLKEKFCVARI